MDRFLFSEYLARRGKTSAMSRQELASITVLIAALMVIWHVGARADSTASGAATPASVADNAIPADPCEDQSKWREYHVSAIDVKMVLNRFGDRDDDAFMYVGAKRQSELDKKIQAIQDWQNQPGCTRWDQPGGHKPCVSTGLRDDLVQPLVLRANLGQCLVIHFTNQLDPNKKPALPLDQREWPNDGKASLDVSGLAYSVEKAGVPREPTDTAAGTNERLTYKIPLPADPAAERAYYFRDGGGNRQRVPHGLFGVIVAEAAASEFLDPKTGQPSDGTGWEAIIKVPEQRDFREFVVIYHEIGDENYDQIIDGTGDGTKNKTLPQIIPRFSPEPLYRPGGRAINYRSEPFHHRLEIKVRLRDNDTRRCSFEEQADARECSLKQKKALGYSSYAFGDPATPIPRSYLGEPTKTRLVHGGSEVFHVHHLHGGGDRWRRNPKSDPSNEIASGLNKRPRQDALSIHLDSQSIGPGTSYNLEHECGAGGCQQAAGDFLFHCHIGQHYIGGMWGLWRVFDTWQRDLAKLPDMPDPPAAVTSTGLLDKTFGDRTVVLRADPNDPHQVSLQEWVESQLPPQGQPLDDDDATVWDWGLESQGGKPLYLGEPETNAAWSNYRSETPGKRPVIRFNPSNGRYAWPLFRPHLGQRPPFAPNGHSGAPWLGENGSLNRPDGLCPDPKQWGIPNQTIRHYPISAVPIDVGRNESDTDREGKVFVLNEDIRGETPEGKVLLDQAKTVEPLVIRSNVGDCVRVIFTSRLQPNDKTGSKVNMHTHFVQFDPQASDGVITGFSYEQSVRPYQLERRTDGSGLASEPRTLVSAVPVGAREVVVNQAYRLQDDSAKARTGIWIGIGLGEGVVDGGNVCGVPNRGALRPRTEIRRIQDILPNPNGTFTIKLDRPLDLHHDTGEAVGVEFTQHLWYSDVDTGTVFWHDHVDFNSWGHGLASAHVIEPTGSTWHHPCSGEAIRSGAIADIHMPSSASVGAGQSGGFREFVLFNIKEQSEADDFGERKATINLRREPIADPGTGAAGRNGAPAHWFSSVTHGDPATPLPRAYVGDPFMIRHLGVVDREGGIRVTGHRFRIERFAPDAALSDGSPIGISERYDLLLDGGAGGPLGKPGDFLYYNTIGRDMLGGAWGLIRVHDTRRDDLRPLPDRPVPPPGKGFPAQAAASGEQSTAKPRPAQYPGNPCPSGGPEKVYEVRIRQTPILRQSRLEEIGTQPELTVGDGVVYSLAGQPKEYSLEPLVLRVNHGDCLVLQLTNELRDRAAGLHVGELLFDPQGSHGAAIGLNLDSTVAPGQTRTYRYYADRELGTTLALDLANPLDAARGAFAAVIVEPKGSEYRDTVTGKPLETGVRADIITPTGKFRELVTLFHDGDPRVGHNAMSYPWQAHCDTETVTNPDQNPEKCNRDPAIFRGAFTSISYKLNPWSLRNDKQAPSAVYSSSVHGDPGLVVAGPAGLPLMFRVAAPWAEQVHVFSLSGHRWPLEPGMAKSEQVFAHMLAPGYAFDAPIVGGFGGGYEKTGDFVFGDARMPFTQAGLWGLIRVESKEAPQ